MPEVPENQESRPATILLAEDDKVVRTMVKEILTLEGFRVVCTSDGREAYDFFRENPSAVDLLLTDVVMPRMNGRELGRHCREDVPSMKILFMSGYVDNRLNPDEDLRGPADFIAKPFRPAELVRKVKDLLDGDPSLEHAIGG